MFIKFKVICSMRVLEFLHSQKSYESGTWIQKKFLQLSNIEYFFHCNMLRLNPDMPESSKFEIVSNFQMLSNSADFILVSVKCQQRIVKIWKKMSEVWLLSEFAVIWIEIFEQIGKSRKMLHLSHKK